MKASAESRARALLSRMTEREKIGQLTQSLYGFRIYERDGERVTASDEVAREAERFGGIGGIYGLFRADPWSERNEENGLVGKSAPRVRNEIQRIVMEKSRLGIPVLFSSECSHGHQGLSSYLLPVNLASAASFSPDLVRDAFSVAGRQMRGMGVDMALLPVLDVLRDPRWGRCEETFGEDPYLSSLMARAAVEGVRRAGVAVMAKHFCAHGEPTGGISSGAASIGERELREIHLPTVRAAVSAGAEAVMATYNEIDGVFCCANRRLLTEILRNELGFSGTVVADALAIEAMDSMTGDRASSAATALCAGVDMGLLDRAVEHVEEALARGLIDAETLDAAVLRVLTLKYQLGLFDSPFVPESADWENVTEADEALRERLSEESVVLLKNEKGLLPLEKDAPLLVGVTGANADGIYRQLGDYTPPVRRASCATVVDGLREVVADTEVRVRYVPFDEDFSEEDAVRVAASLADCDVIVAAVGGSSDRFAGSRTNENGQVVSRGGMDCGEGVDSSTLALPGKQLFLLDALKKTGVPVVSVLIAGRPYAMEEIDRCSDALLCAFYPGPTGGRAIAKILFGEVSPAGRLPVSLPDRVGQLPVYYNPKASYAHMRYVESTDATKYSFGDGLSYSHFSYTLLSAPTKDAPCVRIRVRNVGTRKSHAVPQLYLSRRTGIVTARVRALCAFEKIELCAGEEKEVALRIPDEALMQVDGRMCERYVEGRFDWFVRDGGEDHLLGSACL